MTANPFALDTPPAPTTVPAAVAPIPAPQPAAPVAAPTPAASAFAGGADPFDAPAPQEARGPRIRDLYGRLLLLVPHKLEEGVPNRLQPGETQDRMTTDVIVLDGGPINYGGKPEGTPPVAHTKVAQVPHKTARMFVSQAGLISQCRLALAKKLTTGQPGMVLGRLTVGDPPRPGANPPYLLTPPTDQDKQVARQYLANVDPFA